MKPLCVLIFLLPLTAGPLHQDNPTPKSMPTIPSLPDVNPQLLRLAVQDQSDRGNDLFSGKQLKTPPNLNIPKRDAERQAEVRTLLSEGKVHTGRDYYFAALFQHSEQFESLPLAHILAVTSLAKGNKSGRWLSAATLDRYLWPIKHPQVFGTQYQTVPDNRETMEPYDRIFISDKIRAAWVVDSLAEQEKSLKDFQKGDVPTSSTPERK
jgi:hypothetical protein